MEQMMTVLLQFKNAFTLTLKYHAERRKTLFDSTFLLSDMVVHKVLNTCSAVPVYVIMKRMPNSLLFW